jgi:oligosaccharide reducing-end xylanase
LAYLSLRNRSLATGACSALLALLASACGAGDDRAGVGTGVVSPFGSPPSGQNMQQPPPGAQNEPGSTPADSSNTSATSGANPETQPGDITLTPGTNPGGTNPGSTDTSGGTTTPPEMTPPGMTPPATPAPFPDAVLERPTKGTTNLFTELLGIPEGQVNGKVLQAVNRFFGIGTNESTTPVLNTGWRVYYELPQDRSMAFIWASDSNDIRSEGMSYGMMIALQMDMQPQFNALWKFAQTFMQFPANSNQTSWRGNFRWQGSVNTGNANNWQVNFGANTGPAPDGDEYFAAALYLADRRWGSNGGVNYQQQADTITHAMISNPAANNNTPLINAANNLVVFFPNTSNAFTDPSYNLPAFYELYALDGPAGDAGRWNTIADASRRLLVNSANGNTGLHPDYANFNGTPNTGGSNHNQFLYDAWRVPMNMAVDYAWFSQDSRFTTQVNKYHAFFTSQLNANKDNVRNATFAIDGSNAGGGSSTALTSMLGAGALASTAANRKDFVQAAWNVYQQSGQYRYYQEAVYLLGLLNTAGLYGYEWAAQ